ncbi:YVTN repeat-like/Quino protein amine dehydrogenase [Gonapodya prolifera JEL478]|uniref:YVTN repeat-like/Quino protein amine dehydrogenase n=1 Tax=Gonapodya prolifera (strain JEL478) TaxID=1344416 RepID=A0A139A5Z0_GONPJ|nr:YVTN repeat-like/Quino protein amine dehydrogenase [Gonapodya prolifera JEL478]|eukprot:KXS12161.1 YVTN repeat-like/Quino protein amine dehydrogenase [Gonapodya prolifera JEL478]
MEGSPDTLAELYLLVYSFLDSGPFRGAADALREELESQQHRKLGQLDHRDNRNSLSSFDSSFQAINEKNTLSGSSTLGRSGASRLVTDVCVLPPRFDWKGFPHQTTLQEVMRTKRLSKLLNGNGASGENSQLAQIISHLTSVTNEYLPPTAPGLRSLLAPAHSSSSLLRSYSVHGAELGSNESQKPKWNPSALTFKTEPRGSGTVSPSTALVGFKHRRCIANPGVLVPSRHLGHYNLTLCDPLPFVYSQYQKVLKVQGHVHAVYCATFDRTGNRFITGSDDYLVKIWSARSGWLIYTLRGHTSEIIDLAVNHENTLLASASNDDTIRIWHLKTGEPLTVLRSQQSPNNHHHRRGFTSLAWSPSPIPSMRVLLATSRDGNARLWRWDADVLTFHFDPIVLDCKTLARDEARFADFNNTGTRFAIGGTDGLVRLFSLAPPSVELAFDSAYRVESATLLAVLGDEEDTGHKGHINAVSFSNDGDRIVSSGLDGNVIVWTFCTKERKWKQLSITLQNCLDLGTVVDDGLEDDPPRIPDLEAAVIGDAETILPDRTGESDGAIGDPSPDGCHLSSIEAPLQATTAPGPIDDNSVETQDHVMTSALLNGDQFPDAGVGSASLGSVSDVNRSTTSSAEERLGDLSVVETAPNGRITRRAFLRRAGEAAGTVVSADEEPLEPSGVRRAAVRRSARRMQNPDIARGPEATLMNLEDIPQNISVLTGRSRASTRNAGNQNQKNDKVTMTVWSLDDSKIIVACSDYKLRTFDSRSGVHLQSFIYHTSDVYNLDIHPHDKRIFLSGGWDGYVCVWNIETGSLKCVLDLEAAVLDAKFSPDGLSIVASDFENCCTVFSVDSKPEDYIETPLQQFFATDYDPIRVDTTFFVIDENTQLAPHQMQRTNVCNLTYTPWPAYTDTRLGTQLPIELPKGQAEAEEQRKVALLRKELPLMKALHPEIQITPKKMDRRHGRKRKRFFESDDEEEFVTFDLAAMLPLEESSGEEWTDDGEGSAEESDSDGEFVGPSDDEAMKQRNHRSSKKKRKEKKRQRDRGSRKSGRRGYQDDFSDDDDGYGDEALETDEHSSRGRKPSQRAQAEKLKNAMRPVEDFLPTDWIKAAVPSNSPYRPQVGDEVVYFKEGHQEFLQTVFDHDDSDMARHFPRLDSRSLPWMKDPRLPPVVFCTVRHVSFRVGPPAICQLMMEVSEFRAESALAESPLNPCWSRVLLPAAEDLRLTSRRIDVKFSDTEGAADFIILRSQYVWAMSAQYEEGERVLVSYADGTEYEALLTSVNARLDPEHMTEAKRYSLRSDGPSQDSKQPLYRKYGVISEAVASPWNCFLIQWEHGETSGETDTLSPWDIHKPERRPIAELEAMDVTECDAALNLLEEALGNKELSVFVERVRHEDYPDYYKEIAYPVYLTLVQARLTNGFYRRFDAFLYDIRMIQANAKKYNTEGTPVHELARGPLAGFIKGCHELKRPATTLTSNGLQVPRCETTSKRPHENDHDGGSSAEGDLMPRKRLRLKLGASLEHQGSSTSEGIAPAPSRPTPLRINLRSSTLNSTAQLGTEATIQEAEPTRRPLRVTIRKTVSFDNSHELYAERSSSESEPESIRKSKRSSKAKKNEKIPKRAEDDEYGSESEAPSTSSEEAELPSDSSESESASSPKGKGRPRELPTRATRSRRTISSTSPTVRRSDRSRSRVSYVGPKADTDDSE